MVGLIYILYLCICPQFPAVYLQFYFLGCHPGISAKSFSCRVSASQSARGGVLFQTASHAGLSVSFLVYLDP